MSTHVAAQPPKRVQKLFAGGGVGNETSGTLHVDARLEGALHHLGRGR
jgi:hypothetical protein